MEAELAASDNAEEILARLEKRLLSRITKFNDNYSAVVAKVITSEKKEVADNGKNE